jgi:hypothetical protein
MSVLSAAPPMPIVVSAVVSVMRTVFHPPPVL